MCMIDIGTEGVRRLALKTHFSACKTICRLFRRIDELNVAFCAGDKAAEGKKLESIRMILRDHQRHCPERN